MQEKLIKHEHYYYTHSDFFNYPSDLVHAFLMKDYDIGMHEQEFYEINLITEGTGVHYIDDHPVNASKGDVFIIPPNIGHGYVGGAGFDVFHVILSDAFMNKFVVDLQQLPSFFKLFGAEPLMRGKTSSPLHLTLEDNELKIILDVMNGISQYEKYSDPTQCLVRSNLAVAAIGLLCEAYTSAEPGQESSYYENRALMESISHIHERYFEKITIEDLSRIAHTSRSSYIKKFKEICKMPPATYIAKVRIEAAATMMLSTTLSISDIAERTGFYDTAHLTKAFKRAYNISPMVYRNDGAKREN